MPKHKKQFIAPCAYCGAVEKLTADHVIPECLFRDKRVRPRRPLPPDMPIVYACATCNNTKKNLDDSFLRDLLAMDADSANNPVAQEVFEAMRRAARNPDYVQSPLVRQVLQDKGRRVPMYTPGGIYVGDGYGVQFSMERLERILSTIVRGLYLAYISEPLQKDVRFSVQRIRNGQKAKEIAEMLVNTGGNYRIVGDGSVFECVFAAYAGDSAISIWMLHFYHGVVFTVDTSPLDEVDDEELLDASV